MYVSEESDCAIIPMKLPNKEAKAFAEAAEGRAQTKENDVHHHTYPTQSGIHVSQGLEPGGEPGGTDETFTSKPDSVRPSESFVRPTSVYQIPLSVLGTHGHRYIRWDYAGLSYLSGTIRGGSRDYLELGGQTELTLWENGDKLVGGNLLS